MRDKMSKEIVYVGDPMCSWCWGFAPVISSIYEQYADKVKFSFMVGGLHAYDTEPMDDRYKATIRHHWESVERRTGQPFTYRFFDREGFVLDTEPACRAAVTVRSLNLKIAFPEYFEVVHRAFYYEDKDTTDADTLADLAQGVGVDRQAFFDAFESSEIKAETADEFDRSRQMGVNGYPTVLLKDGDDFGMLTAGYRPFDQLEPVLEDWLNR